MPRRALLKAISDLGKSTERQSFMLPYKYRRVVKRDVRQDGHLTEDFIWQPHQKEQKPG